MDKNFIKKSVFISVIAAVFLFILGGAAITFSAQLAQLAAIADAFSGNYERAIERLDSLEADNQNIQNHALYSVAQIMLSDGEYQQAQAIFVRLGDYSDSADMKNECILLYAQELIAKQEYQEAAELLSGIFTYSNAAQLYNECQYARAQSELENGNWFGAVQLFWRIKDHSDAAVRARDILYANTGNTDVESAVGVSGTLSDEQLEQCLALAEERKTIRTGVIDTGFYHTVGLNADGTVSACGSNEYGQCDVDDLRDVIQIVAGAYHTAALLSDGTVIAKGSNEYGQCNVSGWKNVIQIAANDYNTFALLSDGTVVSCGYHDYSVLANWHDVDMIFADSYAVGCLHNDGYLAASSRSGNIDTSSFFVGASVSAGYAAALSADGNVTSNTALPENWNQVLEVYTSPSYAAVIMSGGNAQVYSFRDQFCHEYSFDQRVVSFALGGTHYALLLEDGSVMTFGADDSDQCDTEGWNLK